MDSLLCPRRKKALTFSPNADTPLLRTLSMAPSVSVLRGLTVLLTELPGRTVCDMDLFNAMLLRGLLSGQCLRVELDDE